MPTVGYPLALLPPVLIAFILWWLFFAFLQIPTEERQLEARFGETYLKYKDTVPRWIGLPRRR